MGNFDGYLEKQEEKNIKEIYTGEKTKKFQYDQDEFIPKEMEELRKQYDEKLAEKSSFEDRTRYYFEDEKMIASKARRYKRIATEEKSLQKYADTYTNRDVKKRKQFAMNASNAFAAAAQLEYKHRREVKRSGKEEVKDFSLYAHREKVIRLRMEGMVNAAKLKSRSEIDEKYKSLKAQYSCLRVLKDQLENISGFAKTDKEKQKFEDAKEKLDKELAEVEKKLSRVLPTARQKWEIDHGVIKALPTDEFGKLVNAVRTDDEITKTELKQLVSGAKKNKIFGKDAPYDEENKMQALVTYGTYVVKKDRFGFPVSNGDLQKFVWNNQWKSALKDGNQEKKNQMLKAAFQRLVRFKFPVPDEIKKLGIRHFFMQDPTTFFEIMKMGANYDDLADVDEYASAILRQNPRLRYAVILAQNLADMFVKNKSIGEYSRFYNEFLTYDLDNPMEKTVPLKDPVIEPGEKEAEETVEEKVEETVEEKTSVKADKNSVEVTTTSDLELKEKAKKETQDKKNAEKAKSEKVEDHGEEVTTQELKTKAKEVQKEAEKKKQEKQSEKKAQVKQMELPPLPNHNFSLENKVKYERQGLRNCYACSGTALLNQFLLNESQDKTLPEEKQFGQLDLRGYVPAFKSFDEVKESVNSQEQYDQIKQELQSKQGVGATSINGLIELGDFFLEKRKDICVNRMVLVMPTYQENMSPEKTKAFQLGRQKIKIQFLNKVNEVLRTGNYMSVLHRGHYVTITGIKGDKLEVLDSITDSLHEDVSKPVTKTVSDLLESFKQDGSYENAGNVTEITWLSRVRPTEELTKEFANLKYDSKDGFSVTGQETGDALLLGQTKGVMASHAESDDATGAGVVYNVYLPKMDEKSRNAPEPEATPSFGKLTYQQVENLSKQAVPTYSNQGEDIGIEMSPYELRMQQEALRMFEEQKKKAKKSKK